MMIKSGYQEGLFYQSDLPVTTTELEGLIRSLLSENHGVGILGGYYEEGLPICIVSELTMQMLGYTSAADFESATHNRLFDLICNNTYSVSDFAALTGARELHLLAKAGVLWVRIVKRDVTGADGRRMWRASICDMEALYQTHQHELAQQEELEKAYRTLQHQQEELEKAYAEAQRANHSKTDFLRRMSHDIRTPINGIRGMIAIANHYADDPEKQKECREKVWEASGYLLSLVSSVLDMNKLESGGVVLEHKPFDLYQLLEETNTVAEMQAIEHGLSYVWDVEHSHIEHRHLIGSATHLKQILMNLTNNAIKYNRHGGKVAVSCRELAHDDHIATFTFICADTGIGMSQEFQAHAYEPFTQEGRNDARTHYDGSGLGLSIVKQLVEQMDGHIEFTSKEGVGTTFYVTLPLHIGVQPVGEQPPVSIRPIDLTGMRALVVEDNDLNMEITQFLLDKHGIFSTGVSNGQQAVDAFAAAPMGTFDMILMDVMMPVMNGLEATRRIRAMDRPDAATIPIVAMSANAFADDVQRSLDAGMNEHLTKPIDENRLLATLHHLLHR